MNNVITFLRARWGWLLAGVIILAGLGGWALYQQQLAAEAQAAEQASIRAETLERGNLSATVSATGSLQANQLANLVFLVPGTVAEVSVKSGDTVKAGQVLVRLDTADLQLALSQAKSALEIAKLQRQQLLDGPSEDDINIAKANVRAANAAAYDLQKGAGEEEVKIAQLQYDQAQSDYQKQLEQWANLVEFGNANPQFAPPQESLDRLKQSADNLYYQAEIARLQLEQTQSPGDPGSLSVAYARIKQAQAQLDQLLAKPTQVQLDQADLSVAQAELAVEQAQERLARTELRAPFDGLVAVVNAKVGEPSGTGGAPVSMIDTSRFLLDVNVNEVDVAQLALGQTVNVVVDALPDAPLTGQVQSIAPTSVVVGGAVNYTVRVALESSEAPLRAGMSATVEVTVAEVADVVLAPNWAIRRDRQTGQAFLSVRRNGEISEVPIETGLRGADYTEVMSGAQAGDEAAVSSSAAQPFGGQ